ncbi:hypothetical protein A3F66_01265 [candidate division TM6 bacterium RIFCSPHIGHO2_12_FULL_32_22]|nr:MAG: hypothetical protein A3F66_01265 [candidate division TM6 bacterium RIFCSPHIGHO2_12_FULL_32_22]
MQKSYFLFYCVLSMFAYLNAKTEYCFIATLANKSYMTVLDFKDDLEDNAIFGCLKEIKQAFGGWLPPDEFGGGYMYAGKWVINPVTKTFRQQLEYALKDYISEHFSHVISSAKVWLNKDLNNEIENYYRLCEEQYYKWLETNFSN